MKITMLKDTDKNDILPLYREVFCDSDAYVNYFSENILPDSSVFACIADNHIMGMLCLIPKNICVCDREIPCSYIYGVATEKEWRRRGVMSQMMKVAVNRLYTGGAGDYFTYLIPSPADNAAIYEKYGFCTVMYRNNGNTARLNNYADTVLKVRARAGDAGRLSGFAMRHVGKTYGIYIKKDREYFERMISLMEAEDGYIDIYYRGDCIIGYRIGFDGETVEEVYDNEILDDDKTASGIGSAAGNNTGSYIMARIINIMKMIPLMNTAGNGEIIVSVEDPVIDGNNGTFLWRYGGGTCSFERKETVLGDTGSNIIVNVGIGELTSHIFGCKRVSGLPEMSIKNGVFINDYV